MSPIGRTKQGGKGRGGSPGRGKGAGRVGASDTVPMVLRSFDEADTADALNGRAAEGLLRNYGTREELRSHNDIILARYSAQKRHSQFRATRTPEDPDRYLIGAPVLARDSPLSPGGYTSVNRGYPSGENYSREERRGEESYGQIVSPIGSLSPLRGVTFSGVGGAVGLPTITTTTTTTVDVPGGGGGGGGGGVGVLCPTPATVGRSPPPPDYPSTGGGYGMGYRK